MKNYIFITVTLILIIGLTDCSNNSQRNGEQMKYVYSKPTIEVESDTAALVHFNILGTELTDFYDNVDSIRTIPLETTDEALIGQISQMFIVGDTLFIADYYKTKSIFAFDLHGRFLYKIHKVGQGPGEYQSVNMVHINDTSITINDWLSWKLIKYDLQGNMLYEKKIDPNPHDFVELENTEMLFAYNTYSEQTPYRLVFTDSELQWKETAIPHPNNRDKGSDIISAFQKVNNGNILYRMWLNDTVYQISPDRKIVPKYHLGFHAPEEIATFYEKTKKLDANKFSELISGMICRFDFFELENVYFIKYTKNGNKSNICIVKKTDYKVSHSVGIDLEKGLIYMPFIVSGFHQNSILAYIDEVIVDIIGSKNLERTFSYLNSKCIQDIKALKDTDDNPIAVIIYFKKA